jgi:alcohol dehydrogenase (NADP+)
MFDAKAYSVASATSPFAPTTIARHDPTPHDVRIEILYCGICHSDLHQARNEWSGMPTTYPCVPGHEVVGRVAAVGAAVTKFKGGDLVGVGCLVDSDGTCPQCAEHFKQFCGHSTYTYNSPDRHTGKVTYGGYSESIVVDERFVLRIPSNLDPAGAAPLLCAGITTWSPMRRQGVTKGQKVGVVGLGGLGHMGVKFARALGAHVVVFTTSAGKKADALRLGAHEVVLSTDGAEMQKQPGPSTSSWTRSPPSTTSTPTSPCCSAAATSPWSAPPTSRTPSRPSRSSSGTRASRARSSAASKTPRRCSSSAASTTSPPTSRSFRCRRSTRRTCDCSSRT